ncbi:hypothetical protein ADUPG1_005801, partial [Aduncisulcus paluster]
MTTSRPLPIGSPLAINVVSLGAAFHYSYSSYVRNLRTDLMDGTFVILFARLTSIEAVYNGDMCSITKSFIEQDSTTGSSSSSSYSALRGSVNTSNLCELSSN